MGYKRIFFIETATIFKFRGSVDIHHLFGPNELIISKIKCNFERKSVQVAEVYQ